MKLKRARKQIFCFLLASYLIASNLVIARAEALPEVMEGATTIADCVMSYYYMSGTSIANTTWINNLYSQFGATLGTVQSFAEQGLMVINSSGIWEPAQELYDTIANVPGYTALGLDQVFQVTTEEAAAIGATAGVTGAATLGQAIAHVATTGVLPAALAVAGGVALGVGINYVREHLVNYFGKLMSNGMPVNTPASVGNYTYPNGSRIYLFYTWGSKQINYYGSYNTISCIVYDGDYLAGYFINLEKSEGAFVNTVAQNNNVTSVSNGLLNEDGLTRLTSAPKKNYSEWTADMYFSSYSALETYANGLKNGTIEKPVKKSPDVIGPNGNVQADYDTSNQTYSTPNSTTQVDPNTQAGKPLTQEDWLRYANTVSSNNNNPDVDADTENANAFQELLNSIIVPKPSVDPDNPADPDNPSDPDDPSNPQESEDPDSPVNPDNPNDPDNPVDPDNPADPDHPTNPDPETYPDPNPVQNPQPVPDPEVWPEYPEQPQYTEKQSENETDIHEGDPWTTPDLLNKFPFCIPNDIKDIFSKLNSGTRQAPHISWRFNPPGTPVDYTFDVDFSTWDSVAILLRNLELMAFVVALGVATKNLILA